MRGERGARLLAPPRHHVHGARRETRATGELGERERAQAGFLGRLQHRRVARAEGGTDRATDDLHRVVPRHDVAGDAVRLAQRHDGVAVEVGQRLAVQLVGRPRVELAVAGERGGVAPGLPEGLAHVTRLEHGERLGVLADEDREPGEKTPAIDGRGAPPVTGERARGSRDRGVDVLVATARDRRERGAVGRIDQRQRVAARRLPPPPADEDVTGIDAEFGEGVRPADHGRTPPRTEERAR